MGYGSDIAKSGGLDTYRSSTIRRTELIFSNFLYFSCLTPATDSALLCRRQVILEKNGD
jgi:hypothetical protein